MKDFLELEVEALDFATSEGSGLEDLQMGQGLTEVGASCCCTTSTCSCCAV
jgi:hypothetical protein